MVGIVGARQVTWSTGVAAWGDRGGWLTLAIASVNDAPPNTADITENRVLQCSSPSSRGENMREGLNGESSSSNISRWPLEPLRFARSALLAKLLQGRKRDILRVLWGNLASLSSLLFSAVPVRFVLI